MSSSEASFRTFWYVCMSQLWKEGW